jgi:hypothetical protein
MLPKGGIRFLLPARQRASCPWEGLPPAWPIFNSQNAPKHKPAPLLPRSALAIPCTPPFRLQKPPTVFIFFWVTRDADPPTNNPRDSAPRAPGRAFLRHGPFSIHKTHRNTNQPPCCLAPPSPFLARLHSVSKNRPPYSIFGSGETLTLPKIIRAAARLVPLGGPSSGMAHFQFTKRAETQTSPRFASHRPRHSLHASMP